MSGRAPSAWALGEALKALREAHQRLMAIDDTIADDHRLLTDSLESEAEGDPFEVIDRFVRASKLDAGNAKVCRDEAAALTARAVRLETRAKARRDAVLQVMHILNSPKLERPTYTATAMPGTPGVVITDVEALPDSFVRIKREPDLTRIGKFLRAGEKIEGAELKNKIEGAELKNAAAYIQIR